jgi:hypothetical protein
MGAEQGAEWVLRKSWCLLAIADIVMADEFPRFNQSEVNGLLKQIGNSIHIEDLVIVESALDARYPGKRKELEDKYIPPKIEREEKEEGGKIMMKRHAQLKRKTHI